MKYFIWLQNALGAGNSKSAKLLKRYGSAQAVYQLSEQERIKSGLFSESEMVHMKNHTLEEARKIIDECRKTQISLISFCDSRYPQCLAEIANPPILLYVKGEMPDFDHFPTICIVGPRKISDYGKKAAYSLGLRLGKAGFIVVSGGAVGCDTFVHLGALKGKAASVLVMGCGINSNYLAENSELRKRVSENGCLISEYPPQEKATRYSFPIRNRILSALSLGTIVIEAGKKSGSLITAGYANEQGKDVFVIPGSPKDKNYEGSNALLRDGAKPLLDTSDIFNEYIARYPDKINIKKAYEKPAFELEGTKKKNLSNVGLSKEAKIVYNQLNSPKFYPDEIKAVNLSTDEVISALAELEIFGFIKAIPGGQYMVV